MFWQHPIIGNGTASFTHQYAIDKPVSSWTRRLLEPHSQYWLFAAEYGVIGLCLLVGFLITVLNEIFKICSQRERYIGFGILLAFVFGNFSDSLLLYSGSGYFFLFFFAIVLSARLNRLDR